MRNQTFVPNVLFDTLLPRLNPAELKVLLIIIRQTLGYVAKNKSGKQRDWISIAQFTVKTGLSRMAVSNALTSLQQKNVINITDYHTNALYTSKERRTCPRIFYSLTARWWEKNTHPRVKSSLTQEKGDTTKTTLTKENLQKIENIKRERRARWGKPEQLSRKRIS